MSDDRLTDLRRELDEADELSLAERPALFERAHSVLVAELNALEEV